MPLNPSRPSRRAIVASLSALALTVSGASALATPRARSEALVVTEHQGVFNGKRVAYQARIERYDLLTGPKSGVRLVSISYVAKPGRSETSQTRPVIFVFNGGPISASSSLHMGAFGPKRVGIPDDLTADPATFKLVDNPYTPLDVADLVFFDPAGTGFSTLADGVDTDRYYSVKDDAEELTALVQAWCAEHGRGDSPKYLVGESYGTIRATEVAAQLQAAGTSLDGVYLLGQAINIAEYAQRPHNIISYAASLPTLAAIAWSHGRVQAEGRTFEQFIAQAQAFAEGEYLQTLYRGARAPAAEREAVARRLAQFTGLTSEDLLARDLKITKEAYRRALIPGKLLGLNDARYVGPLNGPSPDTVIPKSYERAFAAYLKADLGAADLGAYVASTGPKGLNGWDWGDNKSPFGDWPYSDRLGEVVRANPRFRVYLGNGYTDTQTTIGAMDLAAAQSGWPASQVRTFYYRGGHMSYSIEDSLRQFMGDVRRLIAREPDLERPGGAVRK